MKDDTIKSLKKFKSVKDSEDLKLKQKKNNKKLKSLEERESKLLKKVQNNNISNNNKIPELLTNPNLRWRLNKNKETHEKVPKFCHYFNNVKA